MDILNNEEIYKQYRPKVFSYLYYRLNNYHDAEDLCEEVFVKVYKKLESFDSSKASVSTWIFNIAKNTLIDNFRTMKDHLEILDNQEYEEEFEVDQVMLSDLSEALSKLPVNLRDIIILRYYDGYSLKEIASKMSMSYGICKLRHAEALNKLKKYITI